MITERIAEGVAEATQSENKWLSKQRIQAPNNAWLRLTSTGRVQGNTGACGSSPNDENIEDFAAIHHPVDVGLSRS